MSFSVKHLPVKQGMFLPFIYYAGIYLAGIFAENYRHSGQHASELALNSDPAAVLIFNITAIVTGILLMAFALGLLINFGKRFPVTAVLLALFGLTFVFGGIFHIGSPWHGMYGLGMSMIITPFIFMYESKDYFTDKSVYYVTFAAGILIFLYLWSVIAGFDPPALRGLTQRLFALVVFGWIAYVAYHLSRKLEK
ncbi:MAG: DUF998 domain-containing protein [Candidatus Marinimicrobia bacterium]|nr:DUF998 domain-containing protein [Candidatus Neomarinimicrobiota bacterium]